MIIYTIIIYIIHINIYNMIYSYILYIIIYNMIYIIMNVYIYTYPSLLSLPSSPPHHSRSSLIPSLCVI